MADNDVEYVDQGGTPLTFHPRVKDRGGTTRESIVSLSNVAGTQIDPMPASGGSVTANLGTIAGVATAAKQPALGTAGTASADVITVQGIASMTALKTDSSATTQPVSAASLPLPTGAAQDGTDASGVTPPTGATGIRGWLSAIFNIASSPIPAAVTTAAPSYADGTTQPVSLTTAGALRTDASATTQPISAASLPLPTGAATAALQPTAATAGSTTSGQSGNVNMLAVLSAPPTYTTAQTNFQSMDLAGNTRVGRGCFRTTPNTTMTVTASAYAAGQCVGGAGVGGGTSSIFQFLKTGDAGSINKINVSSKQIVAVSLVAYVFHSLPTVAGSFADKTAPAIATADVNKILAVVPLEPNSGLGTHTVWSSADLNLPMAGIVSFYIGLITTGAFTPSSTSDFNMAINGSY